MRLKCDEANQDVAFNIRITLPVIFFLFVEITQVLVEDIDLLFDERAPGTLPENVHKDNIQPEQIVVDLRTRRS